MPVMQVVEAQRASTLEPHDYLHNNQLKFLSDLWHAYLMSDSWIVVSHARHDTRLRLICFPYAGAGALAYRAWPELLPEDVELWAVRLPGRETRFREPPMTRLVDVVDALVAELYPYGTIRPFAFFGHSLGALIAFELARTLKRLYNVSPVHLFASGRLAPHVVDPRPPIHSLSEVEFANVLYLLDGTPREILESHEVFAQLAPTLRADFALNETYEYVPGPPLDAAVTALGGRRDPKVGEDDLAKWEAQTSGPFELHMFDGGHFFVNSARKQVVRMVASALNPALP